MHVFKILNFSTRGNIEVFGQHLSKNTCSLQPDRCSPSSIGMYFKIPKTRKGLYRRNGKSYTHNFKQLYYNIRIRYFLVMIFSSSYDILVMIFSSFSVVNETRTSIQIMIAEQIFQMNVNSFSDLVYGRYHHNYDSSKFSLCSITSVIYIYM